jgi:large subunit ribosomal protein L21
MYAVIKAGGKQHKVKTGDVIEIELVKGADENSVKFTPILVVDDDGATHFGKDLGRAVVKGKLLGEQKGEKVKVFKYKSKTGYARHQGHRQSYTLVEIQDISLGRPPRSKAASKEAASTDEATATPSSEGAGAKIPAS